MAGKWTWMGRYVLVIVIALVLGGVISELALFQKTTLGSPRLNASMLVKCMGYGGALLLLWLLGQRAANQLRATDGKAAFLSFIVFPLTALIVVSGAHSVFLIILHPFLDRELRNIYNWIFVLGITTAALWLAVSMFHHSEPLVDLFRVEPENRSGLSDGQCRACNARLAAGAKYCPGCGAAVS